MRRSGQHAIIKWLKGMLPNVHHYNNFQVAGIHEPDGDPIKYFEWHDCEGFCEFDGILANLEDFDLGKHHQLRFDDYFKCHQDKIFTIILARDPYNWWASLNKGGYRDHKTEEQYRRLWKEHAKLALNPQPWVVGIEFNSWFVSKEYRAKIACDLGLKFSDKNLNHMGNQSSFDALRYVGQAQQMQVFRRFEFYRNDVDFWRFFDPEMHTLAENFAGIEVRRNG